MSYFLKQASLGSDISNNNPNQTGNVKYNMYSSPITIKHSNSSLETIKGDILLCLNK